MTIYKIQDTRYKTQYTRHKIQDTRYKIQPMWAYGCGRGLSGLSCRGDQGIGVEVSG